MSEIRLQRWSRDKQLSFIPPDGQFVLMKYRYQPAGTHVVTVPFAVKTSVVIDENKGMFSLPLDLARVELSLGMNRHLRHNIDLASNYANYRENDLRLVPRRGRCRGKLRGFKCFVMDVRS